MRTYRNTKTGVIITVDSEIKGDWVEVTESPKTVKKPVKRKPKK